MEGSTSAILDVTTENKTIKSTDLYDESRDLEGFSNLSLSVDTSMVSFISKIYFH